MDKANAKFLDTLREWSGEIAIAAVLASAALVRDSIKDLSRDVALLDKRLARVEYSVLGIVTQATPAPFTPRHERPELASPALVPLPAPARELLEEGLSGTHPK